MIGVVTLGVVLALGWAYREVKHLRLIRAMAASNRLMLDDLTRERAGNDEWVRVVRDEKDWADTLRKSRAYWRSRAEAAEAKLIESGIAFPAGEAA